VSDELKKIREVAGKFTPEEIEQCIMQEVETGRNICIEGADRNIINELSKARVVRDMMNRGMTLPEALRELARRMRLLQSGFRALKEEK
jgi:hypothetical protein